MKILYIKKKNFTQFLINNFEEAKNSDIIVFAQECFDTINIENELEKKSHQILEVCKFSAMLNVTIIIYCKLILSSESEAKNSALVISGGKLLGICDEINTNINKQIACVNLYEINQKRICVLIGNNTKTVEFFQIALNYNCDVVIGGVQCSSRANTSLANFYLDEYKLNTLIVSANKVEVFGDNVEVLNKKNLTLVTLKKLKTKKMPTFYKYLHKTIYENFN